MFRRDSCAWFVLRFLLVLIIFLYGMQWVLGRLFHTERFLPMPRFHALPFSQARAGQAVRAAGAPAKS